ncbi:MAG: phage tail protein [Limisphaerales bacterium]
MKPPARPPSTPAPASPGATPAFRAPVPTFHGVAGTLVLAAVVLGGTSSPRGADGPAVATPPAVATLPVGSIVAFGGPSSAIPDSEGWLLCDGRELSATRYPELHGVIGTSWGRGRSSGTFLLPDLRGRFLRGVNYAAEGALRDPDPDARGASGPGGNSGNEVGSLQEDTAGPHVHPVSGVADAIGQGTGAEWVRFHAVKVPDEAAPVLSNTWSIQPPGPAETRPRNAYVNWIIRVR